MTQTDSDYMKLCMNLALKGLGTVAPNPMVGSVIVHNNKIIGQGYHERYGEAHAEVNAINSVENESLFPQSTLYVNLEPCSHWGKTPPCADLIIRKQIKRVVIANKDPFPEVSGRGIKMMQNAGIEVVVGILEKEGRELNKRFFTFHEKHRPYIFLKWAQSSDGFIAQIDEKNNISPIKISTQNTSQLVHEMRGQEMAILVGKNTIITDNPRLTYRGNNSNYKNPIRIVLDPKEELNKNNYNIFNDEAPTIVLGQNNQTIEEILNVLYKKNISSLIVEGGKNTLQRFIDAGFWNEARIETNPNLYIKNGISSPKLTNCILQKNVNIDDNTIKLYKKN